MTYLPSSKTIDLGKESGVYEDFFIENEMINILAGLSVPMKSFPNILYNNGYTVSAIEKSFRNFENREVKFDIVLNSKRYNSSIAWECKGGYNTVTEQLEKYNRLTKEEVINGCNVNCNEVENHTVDISVICNDECYERISLGIVDRYRFPLVSLSKNTRRIKLRYNSFKRNELNTILNNIEIPNEIPQIIRFTEKSKDYEIAATVFPTLVSLALENKSSVTLDELTELVNTPYKGIQNFVGAALIKVVGKKVKLVISQAANCELKKYIEWNGQSKVLVFKKLNPTSLQGFTNKCCEFIERIKQGIPYKEIEGQTVIEGLDKLD